MATAAAIVAKRRRDIVSHFMAANAVSPESAAAYEPGRRIDRRLFERLTDAGVVVEAKPGRYYIDVPRYDAWGRSRRRRVGLLLGGLIAAGAAVIALVG